MNESIFNKIIDSLKSLRVWILIICILFSLFAINISLDKNVVVIDGVSINSAAQNAGISFKSEASLRDYEKILYIDTKEIKTTQDFYDYINTLQLNDSLDVITDQNPVGYKIKLTPNANKSVIEVLGISVRKAPESNIKLGIELEGGTRIVLQPQENLSSEDFDTLLTNIQNRLDIYGASGTKVNKLDDAFSGQKFIIVESSSSNKNDIYDLISRQGKFEAKLGNVTVFTGNDVLKVFKDSQHAGQTGCTPVQGGYICKYSFTVEISNQGATRLFDEAQKLQLVYKNGEKYLSEKLSFYLDGELITSLDVASSFKSQKITTPQISLSGSIMPTTEKADESGKKEMKMLQAILSTQSLSTKLDIVQSYSISSSLGQKLLDNATFVGLVAVLIVAGIVAIRYRHLGIFLGISLALISELVIILGIAAFIKITIDLSAIGGLIAAIGTGVDDQIIITDEYFSEKKKNTTSKKKIKNAFYIILIAYFTTIAAMIPLMFAGLKMLQGFSFMIIIGVTIGVLITRPVYATVLRIIMTSREERLEEEKEE